MEPKLKKLQEMLKLINDGITRQEFVDAFKQVIAVVKDIKNTNSSEWKLIHEAMQKIPDKMMSEVMSSLSATEKKIVKDCMGMCEKMCAEMDKKHLQEMAKMKLDVGLIQADREMIIEDALSKVPAQVMETPEQARDKLEILKGDERLDKSAIKGIEEIEKNIKAIEIRPTGRISGAKGFTLYVNGTKKLLTAQTLNLIPGTGISLAYSYANGRNDITITASGAALSILNATGAVNNSNVVFTFASAPQVVVVNGASYRHGAGVSISGTTATLDNPPGVGGNVYGIG